MHRLYNIGGTMQRGRHLQNRDGIWHFVRRVPITLSGVDKRGIVKESTKVRVADDPRGIRAGKVAAVINDKLEAYWKGIVDGRAEDAKARYDAARQRARMWGFDYLEAEKLPEQPAMDLHRRIAAVVKESDDLTATALLGLEPKPRITLSGLFAEYALIAETENQGMSADQKRRWAAPRKKAIANLTKLVGDPPLAGITRNQALDFQEWWRERLRTDNMDIGTANRDIGHLAKMIREVDRRYRLGIDNPFSELRIAGERDKSRAAFDIGFVQGTMLADGALDSMNEEQRRIVYLVAETGLRLSEACNLTRETIRLDADVPHVQVREDGRRMKTEQSKRDIPLVGVALMAMQAQPDGFPRYRDRAASLSAIANKMLGNLKMRPTPDHSIYSLRHTFEDRLTAVEAPEKLIAAMMGHKYSRPKYGAGPSLEQKRVWLQRIAFVPPSKV